MPNPLHGVRVLELGQFIAGPYAGLQLADLGAQVIKVERPGAGDPFREFGIGTGTHGYSHNFCAFNRNKRSLGLEITSARGREVFRRVVATTDVVLENFRSGVMQRLGLDCDALRKSNPRLIYCSIIGFAQDGPYRDRPAYDVVGQAVSGSLSLMVDPEDPRILGPTMSDQVSGMQACLGILAALHERERTGIGARIEVTMVDAMLGLIPDCFTAYTQAGVVMGAESRAALSLSFSFECSDGKLIAIHVSSIEKFWRGLLTAIEREDVGTDARFVDRVQRIRNFHDLIDTLRPTFASQPCEHWLQRLAAQDVPAAAVNSVAEAMEDPEVVHLGMFHELTHPRHGEMTAMRRVVRIDGEREADPLPPPALGEHTEEVLSQAGLSPDEISALAKDGIIAVPEASRES